MRVQGDKMEQEIATTSNQLIHPAPSGLKASVWLCFGFYGRTSQHVDRTYIVCKLCYTKLKYCGNTSKMRAHMSHFHLGEAVWAKDEHLKPVIPPNQCTLHEVAKIAPSSEQAKKLTCKCTSYFTVKDMRPYSMVENTGFCHMVHSLEPKYVIPSWSFLMLKSIPNIYKEQSFPCKNPSTLLTG